MSRRLLVVDDEPGIRAALRQILEYEGIEVKVASTGGEGLALFEEFRPNVVLLDVKMAGLNGLDTLTRLRELKPEATVVMISGHGTVATAIEATRRGAFDFLEKPLDSERLLLTVRNAIEHAALAGENTRFRREVEARFAMVGDSLALKEVRDVVARVSPTTARVLITGESGTGKELVARAIHQGSPRRTRPFIEVNCAAIPSELIESELFGHLKGSFTGAVADREGKFEQADGGTLFLDEIGDMSPAAQAKVLRALQEGVVTRIGGGKPVQVDVRVLAATNKSVEEEIASGRFRQDLFYRLNVVPIRMPALRERREDVPALVAHFVKHIAGGAGVAGKTFDPAALERLRERHWAGNVRELRNAVERLLILAPGKVVRAFDVSRLLGESTAAEAAGEISTVKYGTFEAFRDDMERLWLTGKLKENNWNVTETAKMLKIPRSSLYKKLELYGLSRDGS
ncbi:MAG: sigma-54 dependent transcriptional regulator [Gemmatimonadota bacterium]|nr:sigma-54 dependent transcriptional regulator [Gemmatimonadota bacterium]